MFIFSVDDLIVLTEAVAYQMMQGNYDRALQSNVATMYSNLKLYGAQLEALYKDFLDRLVMSYKVYLLYISITFAFSNLKICFQFYMNLVSNSACSFKS